jgi:hypothetical protein
MIGDTDYEEFGICPDCKEHCEFVEEEQEIHTELDNLINNIARMLKLTIGITFIVIIIIALLGKR